MTPVSGGDRVLRQRRQAVRCDAREDREGRVRSGERERLMNDLYDSVVHQLSVAAVQLMSPPDHRNARELSCVLDSVGDAVEVALQELRVLVQVRRDDPASGRGLALVGQRDPSDAMMDWSRLLRRAGYEVAVALPPAVDRLAPSARATITRTIDLACGNILQHAPAGARCSVSVQLRAGEIVLKVANTMASAAPPEISADGALAALRHRVDLLGGRFQAERCIGPNGVEWVLLLTIPGAQSPRP